MPSITKSGRFSQAQHNFMEGIAHGMKPRSGHGPSVSQAKEWVAADKKIGHQSGGLIGHARSPGVPQLRLPFLR